MSYVRPFATSRASIAILTLNAFLASLAPMSRARAADEPESEPAPAAPATATATANEGETAAAGVENFATTESPCARGNSRASIGQPQALEVMAAATRRPHRRRHGRHRGLGARAPLGRRDDGRYGRRFQCAPVDRERLVQRPRSAPRGTRPRAADDEALVHVGRRRRRSRDRLEPRRSVHRARHVARHAVVRERHRGRGRSLPLRRR